MFRWLSSKLFGNQTKDEDTAVEDEEFEDAIEATETDMNTNSLVDDNTVADNVNNSAVTDITQGSGSIVRKGTKSKCSEVDTNDTSVWENVEITKSTTQEGDIIDDIDQNMSTWENVEMAIPSPTVIKEVSISGRENNPDATVNPDTSIWENIEIPSTLSKDVCASVCPDIKPCTISGTDINVEMLTSAIESDVKTLPKDSKTDLLSTLSNRSINKEIKSFAARNGKNSNQEMNENAVVATNGENTSKRNKTKIDYREKRITESKTKFSSHNSKEKSWRKSSIDKKDSENRENSSVDEDVSKKKTDSTKETSDSPDKSEPEDFLTMVKRKTAEDKLVWAKKLVYGLGHLKGVDNKEIESYLIQQYKIAADKKSHGWIKDARYHAELIYSRKWIDENLPLLYQRKRDKEKENRKQERKRQEQETQPQEYQSRFSGMCQDIRLLSNPDLPSVRTNLGYKKSELTETDASCTNNSAKESPKNPQSQDNKEKLQNFNQMKSAIEDIISRRSEKPPARKSEREPAGLMVKAVTDADQIIRNVQVTLSASSGGEPGQNISEQIDELSSDLNTNQCNNNDEYQLKDCVVKMERLPGYYHVKSPKVKSPDQIKSPLSGDGCGRKSPTDDAKTPTDGTKGTPKRRLSGSYTRKPWVNSDGAMAEEDQMEDHNYAKWIGNDKGCKMTISSDDLKTDDDCIISHGKPIDMMNQEMISENNAADVQKFVEGLLSAVHNQMSDGQATMEQDGMNSNLELESGNGGNQSGKDLETRDVPVVSENIDLNGCDDPVAANTAASQFQDQFLQFCQQDAADELTDTSGKSDYQNAFVQFCGTKQ